MQTSLLKQSCFICLSFLIAACETIREPTPSAVQKSDLSRGSEAERYAPGVEDEFCPWCNLTPSLVPGVPPLPPPGSAGNFPANPKPGDPTASWTINNYISDPRFAGFIADLTTAEKVWFTLYPQRIPVAVANKKNAENMSAQLYVNGNADNTNANAFKHAYWSKLNTLSWGAPAAKELGDAHESEETNLNRKQMDLHNNELGRNIPGTVHGFPPPKMPSQLYFIVNILNSLKKGDGYRLKDADPNGTIIPTSDEGRK